jgi:hypothetical protein
VQWVESTDESLLYISVLTLGEIRKGKTRFRMGAVARHWNRGSLMTW